MEFTKKSKFNIVLFCIAILATFLGIYALNYYFPLFNDDWIYYFIYGTKNQTIAGFTDIFKSQYTHYHIWGGRSVVHFIAQSLLYMGNSWGDLLNSLAYVVLVLLVYFIADFRRQMRPLAFLGISALIWFLIPYVMYSIVWLTGSANYLWGCMFVVSFTYPYCMHYLKVGNKNKQNSILINILILPWGIIAGWTNENLVVGLIFFLIVIIGLLKYEKRRIPSWMILGLIAVIIGCAFMLLAPGNYERNKLELQLIHGIDKDKFEYSYYFYRMVSVIKTYFVYGLIPSVLYVISFLLFWKKGCKENKAQILRLSVLFFSTAMVATLVMAAAPIFPERVWFGIIVLMIIAMLLLYINLDFYYKPLRMANYIVWIPVIAYMGLSYYKSLEDVIKLRAIFDKRESYIKEEKKRGVKDFVFYDRFEPQQTNIFMQGVYDIPHLEGSQWEKAYANFLGIDSIRIENNNDKK